MLLINIKILFDLFFKAKESLNCYFFSKRKTIKIEVNKGNFYY